ELHRVLRNPRERRMDRDAGKDYERHGNARGCGRQTDVVLGGSEGDDDEDDVEAFKEDALEGDRERVGVDAAGGLARLTGRGALCFEDRLLVVERLETRRAQDRLT